MPLIREMAKPQTFIEYVHGKVVERIVFVNDADHRELDIQFQDKLVFTSDSMYGLRWKQLSTGLEGRRGQAHS
jgi:hypothetical protein